MAPPAGPLDPARRRLTLVAMCIGQGMILLDNTIVNVALPAIQRGLGVTPGNLEWTVNAYALALASLIILGGTLGDRYGRRRLYLIGLVVFTLGSLACGLSQSDVALILCRGLQGIGAALMAPLTLSILVDAFPPEERTTAIGVWASVAGLGFGAGPIVGGLLIARFGWQSVFWVNVPLGVIGAVLALRFVRESRDPNARSLDPAGNALVAAGLFLLTFALIETNVHPWLSPYTLGLLAASAIALALFVAHEARTPQPMVPLGLFDNRVFRTANVLYVLAYAALAPMFFFVTLFFQNVRGWSAVETGLSWIPLNAFFLLIAPFAGRLAARHGSRHVNTAGFLLAAVGMFGLSPLDPASGFAAVWPWFLVSGLGYGMLVPAISSAAMSAVPADRSGAGSGILNSSRQVGAAVGLAVLGSLSVSAVSRSWTASTAAWPDAARAQASGMIQQVAGGEGTLVARALGPAALEPAFVAFVAGYRVALALAGVLLLIGTIVAWRGLAPTTRPVTRPAQ